MRRIAGKAQVAGLILILLAAASTVASGQTSARVRGWTTDLDSAVAYILAKHPNPFRRTPRAAFMAEAARLRRDLPRLDDAAAALRLARLVALVRDGHTDLHPGRLGGFDRWYPVRFYRFTDGLFVTSIHRDFADLAGARVERIGRLSADSAATLAAAPYSADNQFGLDEGVAFLSSAPALRALGITAASDSLPLDLMLRSGERRRVVLGAVTSRSTIGWDQLGEIFGPPMPSGTSLVTPFGGAPPSAFRQDDSARPLHLRNRNRWHYQILPQQDLAFLQINFFLDTDDAPFEAFVNRAFRAIDSAGVSRLVIDVRYNGGGDGTMAREILHELIRRHRTVNRPGRLFLLVGRKTFSASMMLIDFLLDHTEAVLVGEPAGTALNSFGDPTTVTLPYSGMALSVSTRYLQFSTSDDSSWTTPIQVPAPFSSTDFFQGKDPAIEAILTGGAEPLTTMLLRAGAPVALQEYRRRKGSFASLSWWVPFEHRTMRRLGDSLRLAGRHTEAHAAYQMNAEQSPCEWRSWDSLAEGYIAAGDSIAARAAAARALEILPENWNGDRQRAILKAVREVPGPSPLPPHPPTCQPPRAG